MGVENKTNRKSKNKKTHNMKNDNDKKIELPEESAQQQQPSTKRKRKEVAIFGNYRHYYGYRVGQDLEEDPRLNMMKREWFEGRDCLDIGCNSGLITIDIAKKFGCQSILGVDIDGARIEDAQWTLRKVNKTSNTDLLKIVSFQKGNFVENWRPPNNTNYQAIICLSVSKWIHLNWGDDGLMTLFQKVWTLLQPGGVFILEPQPWSSYYKNRRVSETATENYKAIQIAPEDFQDILLDKIGFRSVEDITPCSSGSKSGFDRPMLAFCK